MDPATPYLFVFAQTHAEFRIPELRSIAELHGFDIDFRDADTDAGAAVDASRPFMILDLQSEEHARLLAQRCILVKSVWEFYARGSTYEVLHAANALPAARDKWARYAADTSFRFSVTAYNHTMPQRRVRDVVEGFDYMEYKGLIDMKNPEIVLGVFEECACASSRCTLYAVSTPVCRPGQARHNSPCAGGRRAVLGGVLWKIEEGSARALMHTFDVKKRAYFGNTSMEAEMSLLMANQTLASPGKLIYDPFVGTGSMTYTTAHFGALVFGSDIDGRQMRGKQQRPGIIRAAQQYGVASRIVDLCTFDVTRNPWRCGELFDAIVTDPPYGVRAGAKRLGRRKERAPGEPVPERREGEPYLPPTKPYELSSLATDLVLLARHLLKPGGRLVFFLPTVTDVYTELDVHLMLCDGMELVANSLQDFGSWGRRLITIRKTTSESYPRPAFDSAATRTDDTVETHIPAHRDFREKYFQGFRKTGAAEFAEHD